MTFAVLRALHAIIADALDDIQRVYTPDDLAATSHGPSISHPLQGDPPYASPPPSPSTTFPKYSPSLDFPSLDAPYDPADPAEQLTAHPSVVDAINRIVAAAGQMAATVQTPFLSLCDASMAYHLPSCMRLFEASHTVEILKEAGPDGLHVDLISQRNGVESGKLAHILRLLATHHILRERSPNVFSVNRISSLIDSGKSISQLRAWEKEGRPEMKYHDTDGIAAFIGLNTDELQKSSAYLTEAYLLSRTEPPRAPFEFAFGTREGFFGWLEGDGMKKGIHEDDVSETIETGPGAVGPPAFGGGVGIDSTRHKAGVCEKNGGGRRGDNRYRLERFGKAMSGTGSWEAPGAVFNGFDWHSLPRGSIIVDVGGGIGSTSMLLANAFCRAGVGSAPTSATATPLPSPGSNPETQERDDGLNLGFHFIIQDRKVVVEMGEKAWRDKCPELLDSGTAKFQVHDFFTTQPIKNAAVFFLRVIMHDWPDAHARMILLKLREAATEHTKLVLADFILPLACADDIGGRDNVLDGVEGAESTLAPAPLLANLGKAGASAYWMDLTMQVTFNAQERTLREIVTLALSAGWKVIKVTRAVGSLFGHIVAIPIPIPPQRRARAGSGSAFLDVPGTAGVCRNDGDGANYDQMAKREKEVMERASSRCGTPTFGSRMDLPSVQEATARFGGGITRSRVPVPGSIGRIGSALTRPGILKQALVLNAPPVKKKKPSPLSFVPAPTSTPSPGSSKAPVSPRVSQPSSSMTRRLSQTSLHQPQSHQGSESPVSRQPPLSPMSPRHPHTNTLARRASHAQLSQNSHKKVTVSPIPPSPSLPRQYTSPVPHSTLSRRSSHANLHQYAPSAPNSIPFRQKEPPLSPMSFLSRPPPPPPPTASKSSPIARRSSYAQLPQMFLRKRSGSIIGPSINGGIGGGISMSSLLNAGGDGALNFAHDGRGRTSPVSSADGGVSVLAAAARIEQGSFPIPRSP